MRMYHFCNSFYTVVTCTLFVASAINGSSQIFNFILEDTEIEYFVQIDSNQFILFKLNEDISEKKLSAPIDSIKTLSLKKIFHLYGKVKFIFDEYGLFLVERLNKFRDSFYVKGCNFSELSTISNLVPPKYHYLVYQNNYLLSNKVIFELFYDDLFPISWNEWVGMRRDCFGRNHWFYITYQLKKNKVYSLSCKERKLDVYPLNLENNYDIVNIFLFSKLNFLVLAKDFQQGRIHVFIISKTMFGFTSREIADFNNPKGENKQTQILFKKLKEGHLLILNPTEDSTGVKIDYIQIADSFEISHKVNFYFNKHAFFYPQSISYQDSIVGFKMYHQEVKKSNEIYVNYHEFKVNLYPKIFIQRESITFRLPKKSNSLLHLINGNRVCMVQLPDSIWGTSVIKHGVLKKE